jgi:DNA-binding CsgD family transcriptional regulator
MTGSVSGRETELAAIDSLLAAAPERLRSLAIEGDPGIGKTTLWREGIGRAAAEGYQVLSCRAAQAEARLSFAGLGDLLAPVSPAAFRLLPSPQRRALEAALLQAEQRGAAAHPRAIGTATVSLISALAADAPVLVAVDDVQWLDRPSAHALEFALRRLEDADVALLATLRLGSGPTALLSALPADEVQRLRLGPLGLDALYHVLEGRCGQALTYPVLRAIERASGGNPFYALELARNLDGQAAAGSGDALPVPEDVRGLVAARLRRLPKPARDELLKISALAQPSVALVDAVELAPAIEAGVVSIRSDGRIEFSHPLFGGAVYAGASRGRRRALHLELAELATDVEERARHLTLATDAPDERIASALEQAAEHAHRRGAPEVAGELEELAARRTPADQTGVTSERCLRAAQYHLRAGDRQRARALGEQVVAAAPDGPVRAAALYLLAEVRALAPDGICAALELLDQALACVGDDVRLAVQVESAIALMSGGVGDFDRVGAHTNRAVELAELTGDDALLAETLGLRANALAAFGLSGEDGDAERALALEDPDREVPFQMRPSLNVGQAWLFTGRVDKAQSLLADLRDRTIARGEEFDLPLVLVYFSAAAWLGGDLETAERAGADALRVATLTEQDLNRAGALLMLAMASAIRGDAAPSRARADEVLAISERIGWPWGTSIALWTLGFLALSEGDAPAAAELFEPIVAAPEALGIYCWGIAKALPDAVEALIATGDLESAARHTDALAAWGRAHDNPWSLALSGRCRALLEAAAGDLDSAQAAAERALADHARLPMPLELGRTLLVLGQLQRRRGERRAARESLERATAIFDEVGAVLWAEKARAEVRRIGVRRAPTELTENERLVAELAATGATNREIAERLFMSRRTVEANLARAYRKLGIHSRAELGATMAGRD